MNPMLETDSLPDFPSFKAEHIESAVMSVIQENRRSIQKLLGSSEVPTWESFIEPLEALDNKLERVWGPVGHIDAVMNSDEWHEAYSKCLADVSQYYTELGQNSDLFKKFDMIQSSKEYEVYSTAQKKVIENALRNFRLSGIALDETEQKTYKDIAQELSQLGSQFSNNVLKSSQAWFKPISNEEALAGIPQASLGVLKQFAEQKELDLEKTPYCVTLDFPSYLAVMTHADDRNLREEVYKAFSTRASDQFDFIEFDNSETIERIRYLRHKKAKLLGFSSYAELSLATKMAENTEKVLGFLRDLAIKSKPQAIKEFETLQAFAKESLGIDSVQPWDVSYVSEKLKTHTLSLSQEKLRPYFPIDRVLQGLFAITKQLFGICVQEKKGIPVWHKDVRFFELQDGGEVIGSFYLDLYARANKRGGAWMDSAVTRWQPSSEALQKPVAYLVCNFTPPVENKPACLTHDEVTTLFHEFGHGIHHLMTDMKHYDVSGISGVPWDAVELPSQFMENFCWEREGIDLISSHIEDGSSLTDELLIALQKSRHFQSAMMMLRQIEFSIADFELHASYDPDNVEDLLTLCNRIRIEVAVIMPPSYHRFMHSFSHIFAGGYAAGYFSYKWAEVLSADAFSLFEEEGILNQNIGRKFRQTILANGGSVDPMKLFIDFRGRPPKIDALLRHSGIAA